MYYDDMTVEVSDFDMRKEGGGRFGTFKVRVLSCPVAEMRPEEAVVVEYDDKALQSTLKKLDRRELDDEGLIGLGRSLAEMLLPVSSKNGLPSIRELLSRSFVKIGPDSGLRLRLRLPSEFAVIPWEYLYMERTGGAGMDGFLALDPRIAIIRHEVLSAAPSVPLLTGDIKVVTALASAVGLPELDLDEESQIIDEALRDLEGIELRPCAHATLEKLQALLPDAGIFHFAGHGDFTRQMGARPGTYSGTGYLALEDDRVDAEQLGINLRGNGVRLAVLAGCETGRRDGVSVWSGIAPALVKAEIPAVVANQYTIKDKCAIAFSRHFYQALAGGLPIERAMAAGRIAVYNEDKEGRDWGVPVLYLRAGDGRLFEGASDPEARRRQREETEVDVKVRVSKVSAGAVLFGADVEKMLDGKLKVSIRIAGTVLGDVTGTRIGEMEKGSVNTEVDAEEVGPGGKLTGAKIGTLGGSRSRRTPTNAVGKFQEDAKERAQVIGPKSTVSPLSADTMVNIDEVSGGKVIGTQIDQRGSATVHDDQAHVSGRGQVTLNKGIEGENLQIGNLTIYQGKNTPNNHGMTDNADDDVIEEKLRLDVALPKSVVVSEPFDIVIAVRQPEAPILTVSDLGRVESAEGSVFRSDEREIVKYRIEILGAGFDVVPPSYLLMLRPRENSRPIAFQVVASRPGKRSLIVNAYQEDGALAAQTRLSIEVVVSVEPH